MNCKRLFILVCFIWITTLSWGNMRIVSLAPSITQNIQLLGKESLIIGCTSYCPMSKSSKAEIVATAIDVNVEKIITLKPDYILATGLTKPQTIQTFEKVGIKVVVYEYPKSYNDICEQFKSMAQLTQSEKQAELVLKNQEIKLQQIKKTVSEIKITPKVFFEVGANPLFTVIPNTYMHEMIELAGGKNMGTDMQQGSITRESVLIRNPDVIFITTMGSIGTEEKEIWLRYASLSAVKKKQIFLLDAEKACTPTPSNFVESIEMMIQMMYHQK